MNTPYRVDTMLARPTKYILIGADAVIHYKREATATAASERKSRTETIMTCAGSGAVSSQITRN